MHWNAKSTITRTMDHDGSSGLRTRSKAAPDWTIEESLILVNEIAAIEADCRGTLSSFQKWKIIVQNCNALDVNRNLNQCRRKWDSLLSDYKKIKQSGSKKASFNPELFKGIEGYVREYEGGYDTDPEEAPDPLPAAPLESGSKNQRAKPIAPQKQAKATRRVKNEDMQVEEYCSSEQQLHHHTNTFDEMNRVADKLTENAQLIEAIVKGNNGATYESTRMNGDKIITCLTNLGFTIDELCKFPTD